MPDHWTDSVRAHMSRQRDAWADDGRIYLSLHTDRDRAYAVPNPPSSYPATSVTWNTVGSQTATHLGVWDAADGRYTSVPVHGYSTSTNAKPVKETTLAEDLRAAIVKHSREGESDTPDFALADYLMDCLEAYERAVATR